MQEWYHTKTNIKLLFLSSKRQSHAYLMFYLLVSIKMEWCWLTQPQRCSWNPQTLLYNYYLILIGYFGYSSIYNDIELELWLKLFPHDHWKPLEREPTLVWNVTGKTQAPHHTQCNIRPLKIITAHCHYCRAIKWMTFWPLISRLCLLILIKSNQAL